MYYICIHTIIMTSTPSNYPRLSRGARPLAIILIFELTRNDNIYYRVKFLCECRVKGQITRIYIRARKAPAPGGAWERGYNNAS